MKVNQICAPLVYLFPDELHDTPGQHFDLFAKGDVQRLEVVMATKAGGRVVMELSTANHYGPDGTLEQVVGFAIGCVSAANLARVEGRIEQARPSSRS